MAAVKVAISAKLVAKPGKEEEVAALLKSGLALVQEEPGTIQWFAIRFNQNTFGIFDSFAGEEGRNAHLSGKLAAALMAKAGDLLAQPPLIEKVDVIASKT